VTAWVYLGKLSTDFGYFFFHTDEEFPKDQSGFGGELVQEK